MKEILKKKTPDSFKRIIKRILYRFKSRNRPKIFCIGRNKTGTTSLKQALVDWGYVIGDQREAELLIHDYGRRDFKRIADYCRSYEAFQDAPFSWPYTFIAMDQFFPESKFILTVRDDAEQWYHSLVSFHSNMFADGQVPMASDLKKADYAYKGFIWEVNRIVYNTPESTPYEKNTMIRNYQRHNALVKEYFRNRPDDLLVLNVAEADSYAKLARFLNRKPLYETMPWKNKTEEVSK